MISIVISSMGRKSLLDRSLQSIKRQSFKVAQDEICILDTQLKMARFDGVAKTHQALILFLDEDCELPDDQFLSRLKTLFENSSKKEIFGGCYLNDAQATYSAKAYNSLCNLWISNTGTEETENLLGGCLAIPRQVLLQKQWREEISWGGEDTYLIRQLQQMGVKLNLSRQLDVIHHDQGRILKWIRRAFRQGYHRQKYLLASRNRHFSKNFF